MSTENVVEIAVPKRLPLWKSALEDLREKGLAYGQTIPVAELEAALCSKDTERDFNLGVSRIRRELEKDGFYLSGVGKSKKAVFTIVPSKSNMHVASARQRRASDELARAVILLTHTVTEDWSVEEKKKLTSSLERLQCKQALERRAVKIIEVLKEHAPKLIQ